MHNYGRMNTFTTAIMQNHYNAPQIKGEIWATEKLGKSQQFSRRRPPQTGRRIIHAAHTPIYR